MKRTLPAEAAALMAFWRAFVSSTIPLPVAPWVRALKNRETGICAYEGFERS